MSDSMLFIDCNDALLHASNAQYLLDYVECAIALLDVDALGIKYLEFTTLDCRAQWCEERKSVLMDPTTRSFQPNYRGKKKYRVFGGQLDLTPAGVFLHECGHAFSFRNRNIIREFRALRKTRRRSISGYGTGNVYEDIAECFRLYVSNGTLLKSVVPERYAIVNHYARRYLNGNNG